MTPETIPEETRSTSRSRQRWLMIQRLIITTFLFVALFLIKFKVITPILSRELFSVGIGVLLVNYILSLVYYFILPRYWGTMLQIAAQAFGDLMLAICMTLVTGGSESPFSFLFIIVIINSSFLGGIRSALIVATFAASLWGGIITLQAYGHLYPWLPYLIQSSELTQRIISIMINTGACYLVAFLSGHLSNQLFLSRRALATSQDSLERLADLNENIIQSIDSGLLTMDTNGLILSINRAGLDLLGHEHSEIIGRPWQIFLPQLEHILPVSPRSRAMSMEPGGLRFDYQRHKDGRSLILELDVLALLDKDGDAWGRLFVLKDLTSLSRMEAEVKKAEHLAALGELAAGMAHEVRTPLASMSGAWQMLCDRTMAPEDENRLMIIIGREMERLDKLISDFLSFARPSRGAPQALDLYSVIGDQLKIFNHSKNDKVIVTNALTHTPTVWFDQDQLVQVFWNLLKNAVEAGEKMNEIRITVENFTDPAYPDHVVFRLTDNGPGIPRENTQKIFEPFFTTKSAGTGLGLATISRILHEGGGSINVASSYHDGTAFIVMLPKARDDM
ncbi:MAG: PAS domain S-box protein [Candidatus Adiutrix sp.]|jgi:two-component system sensor histidine kinase PilS (NtrC family)|nr:PAS domain S-box protein [Candidatus Adiutrix sp.]